MGSWEDWYHNWGYGWVWNWWLPVPHKSSWARWSFGLYPKLHERSGKFFEKKWNVQISLWRLQIINKHGESRRPVCRWTSRGVDGNVVCPDPGSLWRQSHDIWKLRSYVLKEWDTERRLKNLLISLSKMFYFSCLLKRKIRWVIWRYLKFKENGSGGTEVFVISLVVIWMMVNVIFNLEVGKSFPDKRKVGKAQCRALETSER